MAFGPDVQIDPTAWVHPTARLYGAVRVAAQASIWPNVVVRAEQDQVVIGARTNIQDFVMIHIGGAGGTIIGEVGQTDPVVLDDRREGAGHRGHQVHEVPRVGVVVVDDDHPRRPLDAQGASRSRIRSRSSAKPFSVRIDSAWNCTPRKCGPDTMCTSPVAGSVATVTPSGSAPSGRPTNVL